MACGVRGGAPLWSVVACGCGVRRRVAAAKASARQGQRGHEPSSLLSLAATLMLLARRSTEDPPERREAVQRPRAGLLARALPAASTGKGHAAVGGGASLLYLKLLCDYVDGLSAETTADPDGNMYTRNLVYEPVTDVFGMLGGAFGKVGAVYSQALLQKRLLVPVAAAAACSAFNAAEFPFDVNYGPVLLGFLTYKAAVLQKLYQDLKPDIVAAIAGGSSEDDE